MALWWYSYGGECKRLQKVAIKVFSLTSSAMWRAWNLSTFDQVHAKKKFIGTTKIKCFCVCKVESST